MKELKYKIKTDSVRSCPQIKEASAEELRVLLALVAEGGAATSHERLSQISGASVSRVRASIALWESEGIIVGHTDSNVIDEFDPNDTDMADEILASDAAEELRRPALRHLQEEIARMLEKPALDSAEIKYVVSMYTEYGLSEEYILILASHLKSKYSAEYFTVKAIKNKARVLINRDIETVEALERYVESENEQQKDDYEIRRILGYYNRPITKTQREYFKRWMEEYCFGAEIISEAYDIMTVRTTGVSLKYMDSILKSWHEAGCKTLEECRAYDTSSLAEKSKKRSSRSTARTEPKTPKYGSFDPQEAFLAALNRSYSDEK